MDQPDPTPSIDALVDRICDRFARLSVRVDTLTREVLLPTEDVRACVVEEVAPLLSALTAATEERDRATVRAETAERAADAASRRADRWRQMFADGDSLPTLAAVEQERDAAQALASQEKRRADEATRELATVAAHRDEIHATSARIAALVVDALDGAEIAPADARLLVVNRAIRARADLSAALQRADEEAARGRELRRLMGVLGVDPESEEWRRSVHDQDCIGASDSAAHNDRDEHCDCDGPEIVEKVRAALSSPSPRPPAPDAATLLARLAAHGMDPRYLERALDLPMNSLDRCGPEEVALLRIVEHMPWIVRVAEEGYRAPVAAQALVEAAAETMMAGASPPPPPAGPEAGRTSKRVGPDPNCEKCGGEGWLWGHELSNPSEDTRADTMTRYTCDACQSATTGTGKGAGDA